MNILWLRKAGMYKSDTEGRAVDYELEDVPPKKQKNKNKKSVTLGKSHILLESHQPNENRSDETHSVCFPGLLWEPIRRSMGKRRHSGKMNVLFRQEVMQVE